MKDTRLITILLPSGLGENLHVWLKEQIIDQWSHPTDDERHEYNLLVYRENTEQILDQIYERYRNNPGFRLIVDNIETTLPFPEKNDEPEEPDKPSISNKQSIKTTRRTVSRQELLTQLAGNTRLSRSYILMVIFSVIVASVGLISNNVAVVIAAMVIAPLLGPNITLALATSIADADLAWRAIKVGTTGALLALTTAYLLGLFLPDASLLSHEISLRTQVNYADFFLALAAGAAGTLAFTSGGSGTLIGVMVAVALLPPIIVCGLMLSHGYWDKAYNSGLLFLINFICVNLAAVLTFLVQGIRPATWWEAGQALKYTIAAICIWSLLLIALVLLLVYLPDFNFSL